MTDRCHPNRSIWPTDMTLTDFEQVQQHQVRVHLRPFAMKVHCTLLRSRERKPYDQMQFSFISKIALKGNVCIQLFSFQLLTNSWQTGLFNRRIATGVGDRKLWIHTDKPTLTNLPSVTSFFCTRVGIYIYQGIILTLV